MDYWERYESRVVLDMQKRRSQKVSVFCPALDSFILDLIERPFVMIPVSSC